MAYTQNRAVNLLNMHYGLRAVAIAGGGGFFLPYLLKAGVSVPGALVTLAMILMGRFVIRPHLIGLAERWGVRRLLMFGSVFQALQYPLLAEVDGVGPMLFALIAVSAIGETLHWTCYHSYFASIGDTHHRGHQLGAREAIATVVGMVCPLIGSLMLTALGPRIAFGSTALISCLSAIPLLWTPDLPLAKLPSGTVVASRNSVLLFAADGWIAAGYAFVWEIALFISLGENYVAYAGAMALAAMAGAIGGLVLGRLIDAGHGPRAVVLSVAAVGCIIVLRTLSIGEAHVAIAANALGAFGACLYIPTLMTAVYTQAKQSPCPLRFHIATEGGWDLGGSMGLLTSALAIWFGAPLWIGLALPLAGLAVAYVLLRDFYARRGQDVCAANPLPR